MTTAADSSSLKDLAFCDLERELDVTRRVLDRLPPEHFAWKPHEKSMHLGRLGMHVATMPQWMLLTLQADEMDMASPPAMRTEPNDRDDLLRTFDTDAAAFLAALAKSDDAALRRTWSLRNGPQVLFSQSKAFVLRVWCVNHMVHHRAQLCIYLRLLNVPVPAVYFNSVDEPQWVFS